MEKKKEEFFVTKAEKTPKRPRSYCHAKYQETELIAHAVSHANTALQLLVLEIQYPYLVWAIFA